jgi:sugar phosphate isomerase/epimerase
MDRRTFLGTVTAATLLARNFARAAEPHRAQPIGLQLYTVRDAMEKDLEGTLAKVAGIGYQNVELAGFSMEDGKILYFHRSPKDLRVALDHNGLSAVSTHVNYKSLTPENFAKVIEISQLLGHSYIVNPWIDEEVRQQPGGWERTADTFNHVGEMSQKSGMQFAYHNHWFEFVAVDGKLPYDILLAETDPKLVKMEMDLCWIEVAGGDPVKYFNRYPGRFPLVHVKDMKTIAPVPVSGGQNLGDSLDQMTSVGSGVIDWKHIFAHAETAGIKYYIVEHDKPQEPFESIRISYAYLEKLRF